MTASAPVKPGSDLRDDFRRAYENRYTWAPGFGGYRGRCLWTQADQQVEGRFEIGADLKAKVEGIEDEAVLKAISSQLWEVAIHRVRRSFEQTHGENTFTAGDTDAVGTEELAQGVADRNVKVAQANAKAAMATRIRRTHQRDLSAIQHFAAPLPTGRLARALSSYPGIIASGHTAA